MVWWARNVYKLVPCGTPESVKAFQPHSLNLKKKKAIPNEEDTEAMIHGQMRQRELKLDLLSLSTET